VSQLSKDQRIVEETLRSLGVEVHVGLAGAGAIGALHGLCAEGPSIAVRADMDAPAIHGETGLPMRRSRRASIDVAPQSGIQTLCRRPCNQRLGSSVLVVHRIA
jgi:hypothetical protein